VASKKKILILHASAGHGHEKAARAVDAECRASGESDVKLVDVLEVTSLGFGRRYRALYFFMIRKIPWLWGFLYAFTDLSWVYFFIKPLRRLNNHFFAKKLEALVESESPDIVISTHFLATEVVSYLKKTSRVKSRLITVITDYMPHAFWITAETDVYTVATPLAKKDMVRRRVPDTKVFVTGIPTEPKFSHPPIRDAAARSLRLDPAVFTVLITSGGAGVGIASALVERLSIMEPPIQQLVVCGTNHALLAALCGKYSGRPWLHFYGFIDNIHELMAASDLVVGKGGGLTITESLCAGKPMVLFGAVPGQESRNVQQVVGYGAAANARSLKEVLEHVVSFRRDTQLYQRAVAAIEKIRRPNSAGEILRLALEN
jgi:processive 1,2-diacylglycerol beta-glucosyltransferase